MFNKKTGDTIKSKNNKTKSRKPIFFSTKIHKELSILKANNQFPTFDTTLEYLLRLEKRLSEQLTKEQQSKEQVKS